MDIATLIGFAAGGATIVTLMIMSGGLAMFYDIHAIIVIGGGCIASTFIRFPLKTVISGLVIGAKYSFVNREPNPRELIQEIGDHADTARKKGLLGLETAETQEPLLQKGLRLLADGHEAGFIQESLEKERDLQIHRLEDGVKVYKSIGDAAPAFGMIGTLIGMVGMFANMSDPSSLGPFMAISLLATLYGALVANLICLPMADKLDKALNDFEVNGQLVIDGVIQIRESKAPMIIREMLQAYLPEKHREVREAA